MSPTRSIQRERGLATLDVLVGIAIFALVAIIAISALFQFRERAYESGATSDVRAVSLAIEAAFTDSFGYPVDQAGVETLVADSLAALTPGNSISEYTTTGEYFELCVVHDSGAWARYESDQGSVSESGRQGGCP